MSGIETLRQKFPQYEDLSDEELADGVHRKMYADMPREEFDEKLGLASEVPQQATEQDMLRGNSGARFLRGVASPITGSYQLGANIGDMVYGGAIEAGKGLGLIDEDFKRSSYAKELNKDISDYEESASRGQKALGRGDFDAQGLLGAITSGGLIAKNMAANAPKFLSPGGATLGQASAQEAKVGAAIGASMPVTNEDYWTTKGAQTAGSAAFGAALPPVIAGGKAAIGKGFDYANASAQQIADTLRPYVQDPSKTFAQYLRRELGDKTDDVIKLLRENRNPVGQQTAGEVAAPAGSSKLSALQLKAMRSGGQQYTDQAAAQSSAEAELLRKMGGSQREINAAKDAREVATGNMRETALNEAGANTRKIAEAEARANALRSTGSKPNLPTAVDQPMPQTQSKAMANFLATKNAQKYDEMLDSGNAPTWAEFKASKDFRRAPQTPQIPSETGLGRTLQNEGRLMSLENSGRNAMDRQAPIMKEGSGRRIPPRHTPANENVVERVQPFMDDIQTVKSIQRSELDSSEYLLKSFDAYGIKPLTSNSVAARLEGVKNHPETATLAQNTIKKVIRMIKDEASGGAIDPRRLYRMRKYDLQDVVSRLAGDKEGSKQFQAGILKSVQRIFDDAIDDAAGGGWKDYIKTYASKSRDVERQQMLSEIRGGLVDVGSAT